MILNLIGSIILLMAVYLMAGLFYVKGGLFGIFLFFISAIIFPLSLELYDRRKQTTGE